MAQVNDSQVSHPTIVFRVNLETVDRQGHLVPNRTTTDGNESTSEADQQKNNRSIFIPGLLAGENKDRLKHDDTFTVKGAKAVYLKKLYVTSPTALPSDLLQIVSES